VRLLGASAISVQDLFLTSQIAVALACMSLWPILAGCESAGAQRPSGPCGDPRAREIASGLMDGSATGVTSSPLDLKVLLDEAEGMGMLSRRADQAFRTCLVSSYDRSSTVPQDFSDTPTGWYANHDWGNNFGWEMSASVRVEAVLLDVDGPGSIVRIWSATPTGTLRIYVDRRTDPVLEEPMAPLLAGQSAPFLPPFAGTTAKGGNLEFPLPFREHVKVTWDRAKDGFFQITYRRYLDPATEVTSFDPASIDTDRLAAIRDRLQKPTLQQGGIVSDQAVLTDSFPELAITAAPSGEEILNLEIHPRVVDAASLRGSILSLRFDGEETVRAPLGDFFGAGPGLVAHATLPLEATADGVLNCRFVMPFRQSAAIRI